LDTTQKESSFSEKCYFDEGEFFNGKPTRLTKELMSTLDEAIELVEVAPLPDHEDIQLLPNGENETLDSEETPST